MAFASVSSRAREIEHELDLHRYLTRLTQTALAAFFWVFLFEYFEGHLPLRAALTQIFLLYALTQTIALLLTPFAMRIIRGGMRAGMFIGAALLFVSLSYAGFLLSDLFPHGIAIVGILLGVQRAFYRVPYALENAAFGAVRAPSYLSEFILACAPVLVGIALWAGIPGFEMLFLLALLSLIALVPLARVPNVHELFSWTYRDTFGHLWAPRHRRLLLASVRRGVLLSALFLLWPLALLFATSSYLALGAAFSLTLLIVFLFRASKRRVLVESHADAGAYLDEYTALKEMGIALGQLLVALLCAIAVSV